MKKSEIIVDVLIKVLAILIILYFILLGIKRNISNNDNESYENIESNIESETIEASEENPKSLEKTESNTSEVEEETFGTLEKITFIIDVTLADIANNTFKGNTSTDNGYSGIIEFKLSSNALENINTEIKQGNTYVVEASPMIETGTDDLPLITVTSCCLATEDDINKLSEHLYGIWNSVYNYAIENKIAITKVRNEYFEKYFSSLKNEKRQEELL